MAMSKLAIECTTSKFWNNQIGGKFADLERENVLPQKLDENKIHCKTWRTDKV